jgi:hypothetical protein
VSEFKIGDKVWVLCEVVEGAYRGCIECKNGSVCFRPLVSEVKPVEPEAVEQADQIPFKVGDPVMSWHGRKGIVEALNEIEGFPITVRHSIRELVSYRLGGVKHDQDPMGKDPVIKQPLPSDPVNPSHYKQLPAETIDIIEAAIAKAPNNKAAGLHWQVLKYALRCWFKNGIEDLKKARWYLDRLIQEEEAR